MSLETVTGVSPLTGEFSLTLVLKKGFFTIWFCRENRELCRSLWVFFFSGGTTSRKCFLYSDSLTVRSLKDDFGLKLQNANPNWLRSIKTWVIWLHVLYVSWHQRRSRGKFAQNCILIYSKSCTCDSKPFCKKGLSFKFTVKP